MNAWRYTVTLATAALILMSLACENKPPVDPNAPKSAEWEKCIANIQSYADCKVAEAGQIDSGIQKRVERQVKTKVNQSVVSEELCLKVLGKLPSDDSCVPD